MENYQKGSTGKGKEVRLPPKRGQIKVKMFKELGRKVQTMVSVVGLMYGGGGGDGSSASTTPPRSSYTTSEGYSES